MSKLHKKRIFLVFILLINLGLATALVLFALKQNINLFYTPTELTQKNISNDATIRVGGMVKKGSIFRGENLDIQFTITDFHKEILVSYTGILPDLFAEGQGVVILGKIQKNGCFQAHEVLAKHDENYMPPEAKAALAKGLEKNT